MRLPRFKKKYLAIGAGAALALSAAGIAAAYFLSTGSGTGSGNVGTNTKFTITQTGSPSATLVPNGTQTLTFIVHNTAGFKQHFASVTYHVTRATGTAPHTTTIRTGALSGRSGSGNYVTGCKYTWFTLTFNGTTGTGESTVTDSVTVAAHGTDTLTFKLKMKTVTTTQSNCETHEPLVYVQVNK